MSKLNLDRLEAVAKAATQGEWSVGYDHHKHYEWGAVYGSGCDIGWDPYANQHPSFKEPLGREDAEHIAAFDPPTALALIERVRRAEERAAAWRDVTFFFASAIKSGEDWSAECEQALDDAKALEEKE